eukprot:Gb_36949 [translate_table: standard]
MTFWIFPGDSSWGRALDGSPLPLRDRCSVGVGHLGAILLVVHPSHDRNLRGPISSPLVTWQYRYNWGSTWFEIFSQGPSLPPHALSLSFSSVSWRLSSSMVVTVLTSPRM